MTPRSPGLSGPPNAPQLLWDGRDRDIPPPARYRSTGSVGQSELSPRAALGPAGPGRGRGLTERTIRRSPSGDPPGRRTAVALSILCAVLGASLVASPDAPSSGVHRSVLIHEANPSSRIAEDRVLAVGGHITRPLPLIGGFAASVPDDGLPMLAGDPAIAGLSVDARVEMASSGTDAYDVFDPSLVWRKAIRLSQLPSGIDGSGVTVAMIDTGVATSRGLRPPRRRACGLHAGRRRRRPVRARHPSRGRDRGRRRCLGGQVARGRPRRAARLGQGRRRRRLHRRLVVIAATPVGRHAPRPVRDPGAEPLVRNGFDPAVRDRSARRGGRARVGRRHHGRRLGREPRPRARDDRQARRRSLRDHGRRGGPQPDARTLGRRGRPVLEPRPHPGRLREAGPRRTRHDDRRHARRRERRRRTSIPMPSSTSTTSRARAHRRAARSSPASPR